METTILLLALILTCCLMGIRSNAARSLAVARLRAPSPRQHVRECQRRHPPTSRNAGKLCAAGLARRALCYPALFAAPPAVNLPAAVTLNDDPGCAGDSIAERPAGGGRGGSLAPSKVYICDS